MRMIVLQRARSGHHHVQQSVTHYVQLVDVDASRRFGWSRLGVEHDREEGIRVDATREAEARGGGEREGGVLIV